MPIRKRSTKKRESIDENILRQIYEDLTNPQNEIKRRKVEVTSNKSNGQCEENTPSIDPSTLLRYQKWKEENPVKSPALKLRKKAALETLKLLQAPGKKARVHGACSNKPKLSAEIEYVAWDSPTYIIRTIKKCILHREWHHLNALIQALMKYSSEYKNYVKEISYLNFLINSEWSNEDILEEFMQLCFVTIPNRNMKSMEVWFRDL